MNDRECFQATSLSYEPQAARRELAGFRHLEYFCECRSIIDHLATDAKNNLYQSIKEIFKRPSPVRPKPENIELSNTALPA